jgi:deoxyadenosine/deoxycytidine kinase
MSMSRLKIIKMTKPIIIFIEGNIAVGKSTFLRSVGKVTSMRGKPVNIQCIFEPLDMWKKLVDSEGKNILERFYENMKENAYAFQSYAFLTRVKMLEEISPTADFIFIERSVASDNNVFAKNCYESGIMSEIQWNLYRDWFSWMVPKIKPRESITFYLRSDPKVCFQRIKSRNRTEESPVDLQYLQDIHRQHEIWLRNIDEDKIINANLPPRKVFEQILSKLPLKEEVQIDLSVLGC